MKKVLRFIDENLELFFLTILLIIICVSMIAQVVMRYVFNNSLSWSEEISRYCLVWSTFFSIGYCTRYRKSLRITLLVDALPARVREVVYIVVQAVICVFYGWLAVSMWSVLLSASKTSRVTPATQIPIWVIYIVPFVGYVLGSLRTLQDIVRAVREGGIAKVDMKERVDG